MIRAAEHFRPRGLRESIIEKDYYVTEALHIIERGAGSKVRASIKPDYDRISREQFEKSYGASPDMGSSQNFLENRTLRTTTF